MVFSAGWPEYIASDDTISERRDGLTCDESTIDSESVEDASSEFIARTDDGVDSIATAGGIDTESRQTGWCHSAGISRRTF